MALLMLDGEESSNTKFGCLRSMKGEK